MVYIWLLNKANYSWVSGTVSIWRITPRTRVIISFGPTKIDFNCVRVCVFQRLRPVCHSAVLGLLMNPWNMAKARLAGDFFEYSRTHSIVSFDTSEWISRDREPLTQSKQCNKPHKFITHSTYDIPHTHTPYIHIYFSWAHTATFVSHLTISLRFIKHDYTAPLERNERKGTEDIRTEQSPMAIIVSIVWT